MVAKEFYTVAKRLVVELGEPDEAILRTIVGRAYYSVFLQTRDWLKKRFPEELEKTVGNSHEKYTNCLDALQRQKFDLEFTKFSRELKTLKAKRRFADYEVGENDILGKVNTEMSLLLAEQLLKDLEKLINKYP
ncbi:TPA: hypothetical protein MW178_002305 [Acinetobacter baumannii]|nr:hypothetical protein [Acinetobacter baumannii]MDN8247139.1 hypothetical protein [Acinetobacter baumannii]MDV7408365.1 hypothetical protein [Acinetobacter baumannii]MDV7568859.1 hypothetical protein [Acinetobacter baumannii]HCA5147090.1 hypothetical protein [Acinetobacter baumannii]